MALQELGILVVLVWKEEGPSGSSTAATVFAKSEQQQFPAYARGDGQCQRPKPGGPRHELQKEEECCARSGPHGCVPQSIFCRHPRMGHTRFFRLSLKPLTFPRDIGGIQAFTKQGIFVWDGVWWGLLISIDHKEKGYPY